MNDEQAPAREPVFNMPAPVVFLVLTLIAIYAGEAYILDKAAQFDLNVWFAFIPLRIAFPQEIPGGYWPLLWTPVTHAFLHASWMHVLLNSAWLAIFGTPVARRYGGVRFFVVFGVTAIAGAVLYAVFESQTSAVLVGASGGIAGLTGVAVRFIFQPVIVVPDPETGRPIPVGRHLATIREVFANTSARSLTVIWLVLNGAAPILPMLGGMDAQIAWQAHIGGFLAGFFMAPLLETRRAR